MIGMVKNNKTNNKKITKKIKNYKLKTKKSKILFLFFFIYIFFLKKMKKKKKKRRGVAQCGRKM
jgi:hypothetical protein